MRILDNIRVLDITHVQAGPLCTMILADMGAEVIKIEPPWGEMLRMPPHYKGFNPSFAQFNRGKKGITLNLKRDKGLEVFKKLVRTADVVVENFSPGTMDRLGLGYDTLKEINPKLIFVSISGFGQYGPYSRRGSFDLIAQAMSGLMSLTGTPYGHPIRVQDYIGDSVTSLFGVISILAAIRHRDLTGRGQRVDVAQLDAMVSILSSAVSQMAFGETNIQRQMRYFTGVYGAFEAQDGYVAIGAPMGAILDRLARTIGVDKIEGSEAVVEWVKGRSVDDVVEALVKAEVPCAPVLSMDKVVTDPHVLARDMIVEVDHPKMGRIKLVGFAPKLSEFSDRITYGPPPLLGEHNEEVLSSLGYTQEDIAKLREERVI
ncbi:MAG: CaiB/BaiF CoA transferase family protein [Candidatus Bathyarchaeia archaeon]